MVKFILTLMQISLANLVCCTQIPLLQFIQLFKGEMTARDQNCVSWILIFDQLVASNENVLESNLVQTTFVTGDLTINNPNAELNNHFGSLRFQQPCSLVSIIQPELLKKNSTSYSVVANMLPGYPDHIYHLIWLPSLAHQDISQAKADLVTFPNAFILLPRDDTVTILTRNLNPDSWYKAGQYDKKTTDLSLSIQPLDFKGSPVLVTVCAVCTDLIEDYKKGGIWRDPFTGSIYIFASQFNGTMELQGVFGLPQDGTNEDGEWDDFIQPTVDGTAVFASVVKRSNENQHIIYHTTYMYRDSVMFVTAHPKRIHYSVIQKLYRPLSSNVWLAMLISLIAVTASVEILIHLSLKLTTVQEEVVLVRSEVVTRALGKIRKQPLRREKHEHVNTLHAILEPLVDQSGLRSLTFSINIRRFSTRIVVGLWFLLVIVINNGYKSMMTSILVRPAYSKPPTTFRELVQSDYYIGCVFFEGSIDGNLEGLNNSLSRQLLQRIHSYSYFEPECYQLIFESDSACVGYNKVFDLLGITFMIDVHYQDMAMRSKENMFPVVLGMGVSRYYPAVVEPVNRYIEALLETGVYEKWWANGRWVQQRIGQRNAVAFAKVKSYYKGCDDCNQESPDEALQMFVQIFAYGVTVATSGFFIEYVYNFASTKFF